MTLLRTTLLTALLSLALGAGAEAAPEAIYGPGPRALDNREIFAAANLPLWQELDRAGVEGIVLNPTFLMQSDFQQAGTAAEARPRPRDTYLTDDDLASLAQVVARTGLDMTYVAGIALSGDRCDPSLAPADLGRAAAEFEVDRNVTRLLEAGIPISAINVDGPMLRLLSDSGKPASCKASAGIGFDPMTAAEAVQAYMVELRDRIEAAQGGRPVEMRWLVNLPNWQAGRVPRLGNGRGAPTTDLSQVFEAFTRVQAEGRSPGRPLEISEIVIDYPYAYVRQNPGHFSARLRTLWNVSRDLNPSGRQPPLGIIVNSRSYSNPCLKREGRPDAAFLTFRRGQGAISAACQRAQIGEDTRANAEDGVFDNDTDYLRDSFAYADGLKPGGELARQLVLRDGTRIADHIAHLYYQSWGVNPLSNAWYMERLIERLEDVR
ncbi:hypothetical protein RSWS8N_20129 (plasmid) [Cereibacter sphaeroides WS8N]|uniref:hypothetical protein n=1 Tax=Cereibacter sphaeroides TaxID=1063 RepID=UPI00020B020D|nr:hypothetical protein [Cereibacter sphaeroides]AZB66386.1 hypothetical protein EBL87_21865 [Cereibacter sphaeroides]AZB71246.1 hypothetical protein EBL86_23065 [Cereibacter sphaeroides]EGJ19500.1 hypothetical protein RSWS8N_20129 [Cereibacter sphaeroides WS8N]MWP39302.1 hypothetical protein [Cereibacter sphaeroides]